jgi:hypothetical protein
MIRGIQAQHNNSIAYLTAVTAAAATAVSSVLGDVPQPLQLHPETLVMVERLLVAQHTLVQAVLACGPPLVVY